MIEGIPALLVLVPLDQRPVHDPGELVRSGIDQPKALAQARSERAQDGRRDGRGVSHEQQHVALGGAERLVGRRDLAL
jgi:hypothetical protein